MKPVTFVVLTSMRTGSNLLNSNLNQYSGVVCHGEAFNPAFVGLTPSYLTQFGLARDDVLVRDADPEKFLESILGLDAQAIGFHLFPGHNGEILRKMLLDPDIKKICLRRSLFQSFVSLEVAKKTQVWLVSNKGPSKPLTLEDKQIVFSVREFERFKRSLDQFWSVVLRTLRQTDQKFFPIWYREVNDVKNLNRIAEFLGISEKKAQLSQKLDKQNPEPLNQIVLNYPVMVKYAREQKLEHNL